MSGEWLLFKQFLRNPSLIGTVVPSAPALCRELVNSLELPPGGAAAELGPGTGVVTLEMLKKMPADFNFFAVELDKLIYQNFRTQFPDTAIVNANAAMPGNVKVPPIVTIVPITIAIFASTDRIAIMPATR